MRHGVRWESFLQHCPTAHAEENYTGKIPNNEEWSFLLQKTTNSILTSPSLSYCTTLSLGLKKLLCKEDIKPQNENTSRWAAHTSVPSRHVKCIDRLARFFPHQYLLLLPQMFRSVQCRNTQFSLLWRRENETYLSTRISPESIAFIHKAHRSLLLFGSLFFCSAHIRERWCKMLTMSTATSTGHCLNI